MTIVPDEMPYELEVPIHLRNSPVFVRWVAKRKERWESEIVQPLRDIEALLRGEGTEGVGFQARQRKTPRILGIDLELLVALQKQAQRYTMTGEQAQAALWALDPEITLIGTTGPGEVSIDFGPNLSIAQVEAIIQSGFLPVGAGIRIVAV